MKKTIIILLISLLTLTPVFAGTGMIKKGDSVLLIICEKSPAFQDRFVEEMKLRGWKDHVPGENDDPKKVAIIDMNFSTLQVVSGADWFPNEEAKLSAKKDLFEVFRITPRGN